VKPTLVAGMRVRFGMATEQEYGPHLGARMTPLITGVGVVEAAIGTTACLLTLQASGDLPELVGALG